ncbi:hypothetical protein [Magnetospirillum moscoviense]|uniref:Uncharacterized protein n=1 Tax=Magnetospirillum moscoviense TaxID=1437059 RepID=A0A178MIG6_9PROT|nr:hypothetical protein [Magnetospirillum moscoviense]OAN47928.1 hypothetical protein A6A05_03640 [Magnetospirillum moscoviense]
MSTSDDPRDRFKRPLDRTARNLPARVPVPVPDPAKDDHGQPGGLARLLGAVAKMLQPKPADGPQALHPIEPAAEPPVYTVLVAAMVGDSADGAASLALFKMLDSRPALKVKPLPRPFQLDSLDDPVQVAGLVTNARHAVADEAADLLVWGEVLKEGYRLRLVGANLPDEEKAGAFGPTTRIDLPMNLGEPQSNLLYAACLAAADPATEVQRAAIRRLLPPAVTVLEPLAAKPPVALAMNQQRTVQLVFGHLCAACAQVVVPSQSGEWFKKSVDAYRAAEKRLARTDPGWEAGLINKHLAAVLTTWAEKSKEDARAHLEEAVKHWRVASESLNRATMPQEWAAVQTRMGVALYRLDLLTGDSDLLREALNVLQAALQVHTRHEAPQRWSDVMNTIAQVLEVYGDQMKNPDVLKRAVDTCHTVLEVRTRERTPLAWASTANTLGSALFLLDRHGGGGTHLAEAEVVLAGALEVFQAYGAKGPAQVAARNLAHVRKLAEDRKSRAVIDPGWK